MSIKQHSGSKAVFPKTRRSHGSFTLFIASALVPDHQLRSIDYNSEGLATEDSEASRNITNPRSHAEDSDRHLKLGFGRTVMTLSCRRRSHSALRDTMYDFRFQIASQGMGFQSSSPSIRCESSKTIYSSLCDISLFPKVDETRL